MRKNSKIAFSVITVLIITGIAFSSFVEKDSGDVSSSTKQNSLANNQCNQTTAKAHVPNFVKQPMAPLSKLPNKFTFNTNCGLIEVTLDSKAPVTISSLASLIKGKYYDNSLCHRLTTEGLFVLQCGDPTLTGAGNPTGWKGYIDENLPKNENNNYPAGTVAMANSGPGTNGSQFFLVYSDSTLGPNYTIWGKITRGLEIIKYIAEQGAVTQDANGQYVYTNDGFTAQPVEIISAKVL